MVVLLTVYASSAAAQEFQFPQRPFGFGSVSQARSSAQADFKKSQDRFNLDFDRNAAWPTPFREMDRSTYYEWFQPCLDRGWEIELTLSDACFDESGKLNRLGAAKVMQAVRRAPTDRRNIYVWGDSAEKTQSRIASVQEHVQTEFGRSANLVVSATTNFPVTGRGSYAESITRSFQQNLPTPTINAQPVSGAVGGE
jgi:hypothetical protein